MDAETSPYAFEFVPAPVDLAPYLNSLYLLRVSAKGVQEQLPAYSGQLLVVRKGRGTIDFGDGPVKSPKGGFFVGPLTVACPFSIDGPAEILGVSFTFHGWAALTRLPVSKTGDRMFAPGKGMVECTEPQLSGLAAAFESGEIDAAEGLDRLADLMREWIEPLPPEHARLIETVYDWLNSSFSPQPPDLYAKLPYSERQTQRLVKRFFGLPPARLKRRFRAIRAATLLGDIKLSEDKRNEIRDAFYDQAHLIREIREFTGRTPRFLSQAGKSIVGDMLGPEGYGLADLFASSGLRLPDQDQDC